jgi:L-rhamnose mutarotase
MKMMMKHRPPVWLGLLVLVAAVGCAEQEPRRFAMVTELRPDRAEYYRELHANPWPEVTRRLKESNIHNYSIYECENEGRLWLFSYFEYRGRDFDADMKAVANDPVTQKWWRETDPCQIPLPGAARSGEIWTPLQEVFRLQ